MTTLTDGDRVRARVLDWPEAQTNNALDEPDPVIPELADVEEWQTGELTIREVNVAAEDIHYTRYMVNGYDVDPDTVTAA